jgi:hypothetical protein
MAGFGSSWTFAKKRRSAITSKKNLINMITFKPINNGKRWAGADWSIVDEKKLAVLIARVAVGQYRHVLQVLKETDCIEYAPIKSTQEGAIKLLTAQDPKKPWHRDGWMFQVMAWIAANIQDPKSLKAPPQMIHAHKGFDGIHLCMDESNKNVVSVIVCEEKATKSPRGKITSQVWPEFRALEAGTRDNELVSDVATILSQNGHIDTDSAVNKILWEKARAYRISITIGDNECSEKGRNDLFKGFKKVAPGDNVEKRRAETFYQSNLRAWMKKMAKRAIAAVKEMEVEDV